MSDTKLRAVISVVDQASGKLRGINKQLATTQKGFLNLGREINKFDKLSGFRGLRGALGGVGHELGKIAAIGAGAAAAAGAIFKTQFVDVAADFEKFGIVLETLEGDAKKAKESFAWINKFAVETPFELKELTEAFVRLRNAGINPMDGSLRILGDAAAGMSKPIADAVDAITTALTGENERLKAFGISASVAGKQVTYSWIQNGKQMTKTVDRTNKALIASTLEAIWNDKYAGLMAKQSKAWSGMTSNFLDQWTRFTSMVMSAGVFDAMKGKLDGLLNTVNRMAEDGTLQAWANKMSASIVGFINTTSAAIPQIIAFIDQIGGIKTIAIGLAAVISGPLVTALATLAIALTTTPIGVVIAGLAAMTAAFWGVVKVVEFLQMKVANLFEWLGNIGQRMKSVVSSIHGLGGGIPTQIGATGFGSGGLNKLGADLKSGQNSPLKKQSIYSKGPRADVGGAIDIRITSEGRPKVSAVKNNNPKVSLNVDTGYSLVGVG